MRKINLPGLYLFTAACLIGIGLLLLARHANADSWAIAPASCYPNFDDFDYRYRVQDGPDAIVWWCDTEDGLETNARAGELGTAAERLQHLALTAMRDPVSFDLAVFNRPLNDPEKAVIAELEKLYEPRCYVETTSATTAVVTSTSQNAPGPSKVDAAGKVIRIAANALVACGWRLKAERRYCSAFQQRDTLGRAIETDAWVPCRIERAPDAGWAK